VIGRELLAISGDALAQRCDLARDGVVARLALGRDARTAALNGMLADAFGQRYLAGLPARERRSEGDSSGMITPTVLHVLLSADVIPASVARAVKPHFQQRRDHPR